MTVLFTPRIRAKAGLAILISSLFTTDVYAGGWPFKKRAAQEVQAYSGVRQTSARVQRPSEPVAPSPMLGSFVPNQTMWVRGNGLMGGGYTPLDQDERDSLALYGPFSPSRGQMKPVRVLQPTGFGGGPAMLREGDAVAYPNYPWRDSLPNLSSQGRAYRPGSPAVYPGWATDADTIDQQ